MRSHPLPLIDGDDHLASLRPCILADNPILGHEVDQTCGSAIADPQCPLEQRATPSALADHHVHCRFVQIVTLPETSRNRVLLLVVIFDLQLHELLHKVLFTGAAVVDDRVDFIVAQVSPLASKQGTGPRPQKEHVPVSEQLVSSVLIEHHAAIGSAGDLETNPCGQIAFDQTCDHIDRRLLRREDQVDPNGPALLR